MILRYFAGFWMVFRILETVSELKIDRLSCLLFLSKVYKCSFWMRKHLAATWKRTWFWSTSPHIRELDLGRLLPSERATTVQTTKRWTKNGKKNGKGPGPLREPSKLESNGNMFALCFALVQGSLLSGGMISPIFFVYPWSVLSQYTWRFASNLIRLFPDFKLEKHHEALPPVSRYMIEFSTC